MLLIKFIHYDVYIILFSFRFIKIFKHFHFEQMDWKLWYKMAISFNLKNKTLLDLKKNVSEYIVAICWFSMGKTEATIYHLYKLLSLLYFFFVLRSLKRLKHLQTYTGLVFIWFRLYCSELKFKLIANVQRKIYHVLKKRLIISNFIDNYYCFEFEEFADWLIYFLFEIKFVYKFSTLTFLTFFYHSITAEFAKANKLLTWLIKISIF